MRRDFVKKSPSLRRFLKNRKSAFSFVHAMPKIYEAVVLLSSALSEDSARAVFSDFQKGKIEDLGGKIVNQDFWGRRRLAYPIAKSEFAHYIVTRFEFDGALLADLDEEMRLEKNIIRHLLVVAEGDFVTAEQTATWNRENLPEKLKAKKPVEKRAPRRPRHEEPVPEASSVKKPKEDAAMIDRRRLDAELDAILEN